MLVEHLVVEASISHSEAGKLAGVAVGVLTASDGGLNQSVLQKLLVEVTCVPAEIANQVAYLGPNSCIFVANQCIEIYIDVGIVDRLIELLRDARELRYETQSVYDEGRWIVSRQQSELGHGC